MFALTGSQSLVRGPRCSGSATMRAEDYRRLSRNWLGEPCVAFSLERLFRKNRLEAPSPDGIPFDIFRVGDEILAGHYFRSVMPVVEWHGYSRIEYRVEVKNYEIYQLLIPLSRSYAELCFVDGEISLDSGEINAMYVTRGRCSRSTLPEDRCDAHWQRAAKRALRVNLRRGRRYTPSLCMQRLVSQPILTTAAP